MRFYLLLLGLCFTACRWDGSRDRPSERPFIASPTVVYIIVDGLRLDTFLAAMNPIDGKPPEALSEVFGERLSKSRWVIDNHSVFPSVTFASNASLVTGAAVREHGIAGNAYLDRKTGRPADLVSGAGMSRVFRRDLADKALLREPMYAAFPHPSLVSFHFFGRGASWVKPESLDAVVYGKNPGIYDHLATTRLLGRLLFIRQNKGVSPRVITLYWPGLDEVTHRSGVKSQVPYVRDVLNANFKVLLDGVVGTDGGGLKALGGGLAPYTFVLTSDHGLGEVRSRIISAEVARVVEDALAALPEVRTLTPDESASMVHLASNGGMMHIYLRMPNTSQRERMSDTARGLEILETVGRALRDAPALTDKLDFVFVSTAESDGPESDGPKSDGPKSGSWECVEKGGIVNRDLSAAFDAATIKHQENTFRYFGAKESLPGLGRAGGDIVLTADYDAGYGFIDADNPTDGEFAAIHGNLFAEDMRVPLVIAGRGVQPGIVSARGGNLNPARIVADLIGAPLKGKPAPVFTPVKTSSPIWVAAPARWATVDTPYVAALAAVSPAGRTLTLSLRKGPPGMLLDRASQTLRWVPRKTSESVSPVVVDAVDPEGRKASLKFSVTAFPKSQDEPTTPRAR